MSEIKMLNIKESLFLQLIKKRIVEDSHNKVRFQTILQIRWVFIFYIQAVVYCRRCE